MTILAQIFDEESFVENNILEFDKRLDSPVIRYIDQSPTFVTYFHINNTESTSDEGFGDVESVIGAKSAIKFQKIENLPIYGIDQLVAQLEDNDEGLTVSIDGEGTIAPGSIKPFPQDHFIIPHLGENYIFKITSFDYDNLRGDNFYKIHFSLYANDEEKVNELNELVHDTYTCIMSNIGTENKCIIQADFKEQLDKVDALYSDMVQLFLSIFYSERYNCLLSDFYDGCQIFDPFMSEFINKHDLLNKKNSTKTVVLETQFSDPKRMIKYERSIYRFVERKDIKCLKPFYYITFRGCNNRETLFYRYSDINVKIVDIPANINEENAYRILSDSMIATIKMNGFTQTKYAELFKNFVRGNKIDIYDIPLDMNDQLLLLDGNIEMFFITPLLLYIIKEVVKEFHKTGIAHPKEENDEK